MDIAEIMSAISTVGFPIVACIAMFIRMDKSDTKHKEEIDNLSTAINNNTIAMTKLYERLDGDNRE